MNRNWNREANVCDEFVLSTYEYYSVDTVAELLLPTGLLIDKSTQYIGAFEKYVFLNGNKDEIYTKQEIDFISAIGDIAIFMEFHKKTKKCTIPCKVVVARNSKFPPVYFSIAFTKIVNKASNGFNICVLFSEEGIIFTCRAYNETRANNYYISNIITTYGQMEEMCNELMYSANYDVFINYYSYVSETIRFKPDTDNYLSKRKNAYQYIYNYMDELWELENITGLNLSKEIERCFWRGEEQHKESYADRVAEVEEYLFKIESSPINTMELLFKAEKMEKLDSEVEQRNQMVRIQDYAENENKSEAIDLKTKALLENPEMMIKLLKKKRGI